MTNIAEFASVSPEQIMAEVEEWRDVQSLNDMLRRMGPIFASIVNHAGLSQSELARRIDDHQSEVSLCMAGLNFPWLLRRLPKLAEHLDASALGNLAYIYLRAQALRDQIEDGFAMKVRRAVTEHIAEQMKANPGTVPVEPPIDEIARMMGRKWAPFNASIREHWRQVIRRAFQRFR